MNQGVLGLWGAQAVVVQLVKEVEGLQSVALGLVEARVIKALAIFGPGRAGELDPVDDVGQVFAGLDLADVPLLPVRAGAGQAIGSELAIAADRETTERNRAFFGQGVRIQQDSGRAGEGGCAVDDALVL